MAKTQPSPISPPQDADRELLADFSSILQNNLEELFESSHEHSTVAVDPIANEGTIGDIKLMDDGTNKYLVVRYSDGWYKTANLTTV